MKKRKNQSTQNFSLREIPKEDSLRKKGENKNQWFVSKTVNVY
jgi:hypothetical protein